MGILKIAADFMDSAMNNERLNMQNTAGRVKTFETLWGELRMKFVAYRIGFNSTLSFKDSYQDTS